MIRNGMRPIHSEEILRGEYLELLKMSVNAHFQCVACTDYRLPTTDYRPPTTRYLKEISVSETGNTPSSRKA